MIKTNKQKKPCKIALLIAIILAIALFGGCSAKYTDFSYKIRGCIGTDRNSTSAYFGAININKTAPYSEIEFKKTDNTIKILYSKKSQCKMINVAITNLTAGTYTIESYEVQNEDTQFFEMTESKNFTVY